jgi:hypothetical protein
MSQWVKDALTIIGRPETDRKPLLKLKIVVSALQDMTATRPTLCGPF